MKHIPDALITKISRTETNPKPARIYILRGQYAREEMMKVLKALRCRTSRVCNYCCRALAAEKNNMQHWLNTPVAKSP